ncbi:schlafen-like protein 1 [Elysia marginata]|uniref:Schlafen-like protein 1 n=1 Tax=Elysia marginata TaxID=1093978 RepID=A0AAV4HEB2_9GAST|nr:schlafen-like protein 1 [Elysia marginata]
MAESSVKSVSSKVTRKISKVRGVNIKPLLVDRSADEMVKSLFRLFYCLGVKSADICQITVSQYEGVASVVVRTTDCENYLMAIFRDPASIMNLFDLRRITKDPRKVIATRLATKNKSSQEAPVLTDSKEGTPAPENNKLEVVKDGKDEKPINLKGALDISSILTKQDEEATETNKSQTSSMSFSQHEFEHLDSEEDPPKKNRRYSEIATSTTDFAKCAKKIHSDANEESQQFSNLEDIKEKKRVYQSNTCEKSKPFSNTEDEKEEGSLQKEKDSGDASEVQVPNEAAEVKIKEGRICENNVISLNFSAVLKKSQNRTVMDSSEPHSSQKASRSQEKAEDLPVDSWQQDVIKLHVKTSTPTVTACGCPETVFYHYQQHIGTETRHAEFKRGGAVFEQTEFRWMIGKYMCGFLNSEGGTIYFGVSDDGKVLGINVDATLEDVVRQDVNFAAQSLIEPRVASSEYSVNFAGVMKPNGQLEQGLKVLEVCVKPRRPPKHGRYSCGDCVYIKRDGSLQCVERNKQGHREGAHPQRR